MTPDRRAPCYCRAGRNGDRTFSCPPRPTSLYGPAALQALDSRFRGNDKIPSRLVRPTMSLLSPASPRPTSPIDGPAAMYVLDSRFRGHDNKRLLILLWALNCPAGIQACDDFCRVCARLSLSRPCHSRESGNPGAFPPDAQTRHPHHPRSSYKSLHAGLDFSINSSFHCLLHFLRRFSRTMAESILSNLSK